MALDCAKVSKEKVCDVEACPTYEGSLTYSPRPSAVHSNLTVA